MKLFSKSQIDKVVSVAEKTKQSIAKPKKITKNVASELQKISQDVIDYFPDSEAVLIESKEQLHDYVTKLIESGYAGIDTETTGLDRVHDWIVGSSLYYPGGVEVYIPNKHLVPLFDQPYKNQLSYEDVHEEFQRIADSNVKLIFANADFDLAMINKDYNIDFNDRCYYDVILAWRCIKEDEKHNGLKELYNKYVLKGKGDPKKFTDFFSVALFPYCKPEIAKLYAANDAKITFELFTWQLPYVTKDHPKCKKHHLQRIADLLWNVEIPLIHVCQNMHRDGIYLDKITARSLQTRYHEKYDKEVAKLRNMVQEVIDSSNYTVSRLSKKPPFSTGAEFNPTSPLHVKHLLYTLMGIPQGKDGGTGKEILGELHLPITDQILNVRSISVLINTFVDKLPNATTPDSRIHAQFKQIGASTGRLSSAEPNMQNIPSHAVDIRHMFAASPRYVLMSSDYSQQEPKIAAYVSQDKNMIDAFKHNKDIYATIAAISFNQPYEKCLEFHPETHEYQPEGKAMRGEAKTIVLGILYGRSVTTIGEQLYGKEDITTEERTKKAQKVYDSVLNAFPGLRDAMINAQKQASTYGYTQTILGRRRHIPDMMLPEFEFKAMPGYVNPDVDPMDINTLQDRSDIPKRVVDSLKEEFSRYKYYGQIVKRTKELAEQKIRVINNRRKITDASRQCLNSVIQGSAAEMTKMAMLKIDNNKEFHDLGARLLIPVHDELIVECPKENYERVSELLSNMMSEAGNFLPFTISCDVEVTRRWYGLEYPCKYAEPNELSENLTENEIKWIQYHIVESEYLLPIFKDENGDKPRGDAAKGVNGIWTQELQLAIDDYCNKFSIDHSFFLQHIKTYVGEGILLNQDR